MHLEHIMMTQRFLAAALLSALAVVLWVGTLALKSELTDAWTVAAQDEAVSSYELRARTLCQDRCDIQTVLNMMSDRH